MFIAAIIVTKGKPPYNVFLKPFVEQLQTLKNPTDLDGFTDIRILITPATMDTSERPDVQGFHHHGDGKGACPLCKVIPKSVPKGKGTVRLYTSNKKGTPRTHQEILDIYKTGKWEESVVVAPSILW